MNILFTGSSSFTGYWFARELAQAGHSVVITLRRSPGDYSDEPRRERVHDLIAVCQPAVGVAFGDDGFIRLLGERSWDLICHHAADVTNYKSPDFDWQSAARSNTLNLAAVLEGARASGCNRLVCTGSVFENDEGAGSEGLPAFSPYGLSKSLSWQVCRHYGIRSGFSVGKFVIPNPFGPLEEPRFTAYLMKNWAAGKTATVNTPEYVRDNIHVSLLARCYRQFVETLPVQPGLSQLNPSGYVESQGAFTLRFAEAMRKRLGLACDVTLARQTDFGEPRIRINTDVGTQLIPDWNEDGAWDHAAEYYARATR